MGTACRLEAWIHHVRELQVFSWRKFGFKILHEKNAIAEIMQRFRYISTGEMKPPLSLHHEATCHFAKPNFIQGLSFFNAAGVQWLHSPNSPKLPILLFWLEPVLPLLSKMLTCHTKIARKVPQTNSCVLRSLQTLPWHCTSRASRQRRLPDAECSLSLPRRSGGG